MVAQEVLWGARPALGTGQRLSTRGLHTHFFPHLLIFMLLPLLRAVCSRQTRCEHGCFLPRRQSMLGADALITPVQPSF